MKTFLPATSVVCVLLFAACNDDDNNNTDLSTYDRDFLTSAAQANLAEIRAGEVASTRASDDEVKDFGEHMVTEHTTAWNDLVTVAEDKNYDLPDEPDEEHRRKLDELRALSGYSFDTAYVNSHVKDHEMAISLFRDASSSASHQGVKDYAKRYLPHLEEHLKHAQDLKIKLYSDISPN